MEILESILGTLEEYVWSFGPSIGGESIPIIMIALLGTGIFLTIRLGFIQFRRLAHGFAVTSGIYDDPDEPGDVPHFQALTTALSATVGIGNIAGVAIAIHLGGPGALFWMWVTALFGMAIKYAEVTLAQKYRIEEAGGGDKWTGSVSGGPMYYIERGLGRNWKPVAVFFAGMLMITSFLTGNAVQANTVADQINSTLGVPVWATGLCTSTLVALVILGGITRIGRVTGILAPAMALIYIVGALVIIGINYESVFPSFQMIFREAFNPTSGVAGTGTGVFMMTLVWGIRRGLFSNEAGQGSAPIAHAAAKTDEPVSEGVVALLEPFIDTILICTMTGLVILTTGVWTERVATPLDLSSGDITYIALDSRGVFIGGDAPSTIRIADGIPEQTDEQRRFAWHDVAIDKFFTDEALTQPFTGTIRTAQQIAVDDEGNGYEVLYGEAVETGAPLTAMAFTKGLGGAGNTIVLISVLLFAISTSISWSYYGDRCANYLFGEPGIIWYKVAFVIMHFVGATVPLATIWVMGDVALGIVTFPNLIALVMLSGVVARLSNSYFERKPYIGNRPS